MSSKAQAKGKANPLALEDTLRDLALLRASDLDLSSVLTPAEPSAAHATVDATLERSREFVRLARSAIRLRDRGDVEMQGDRVEELRNKLTEVVTGLDSNSGAEVTAATR
ncbi:hypothetical protein EVG20_g11658 [Dentipellis fragilis]|uniref:Uncharacterized protein n=1 Tax=Dentipellis fragilis TaxID=205917 RepID=A0A4Y9XJT4_9AGAM|nr:hypothetical protein EVG20_g11658 [Dentipellis fragilis]